MQPPGYAATIHNAEHLLHNLTALIGGARRAGVPVLYVQHVNDGALARGSDAWRLHPRNQPLPTEPIVHKRHGNAFEETVLRHELDSRHVRTLVMAGLVTHGCVKATCIGALELGYPIILVSDAHSSFNKQAAKRIDEWNQKLSGLGAELRATREVDFWQL